MNVLAIVAHPDDEVIGCGATLAKLKENKSDVRVLLPLRRNDSRGVENWSNLTQSFIESCEYLGATAIIASELMDEQDAEGKITQLHDIILPMVEWAHMIFTHWLGDANQVHRAVARAVEVATRPFRRHKEVYLFEVATSTEQAFSPSFMPNAYSVVSETHARKKSQAISFYPTEMEGARTPEGLLRKLQVRGDEISAPFAEAFFQARHFF